MFIGTFWKTSVCKCSKGSVPVVYPGFTNNFTKFSRQAMLEKMWSQYCINCLWYVSCYLMCIPIQSLTGEKSYLFVSHHLT